MGNSSSSPSNPGSPNPGASSTSATAPGASQSATLPRSSSRPITTAGSGAPSTSTSDRPAFHSGLTPPAHPPSPPAPSTPLLLPHAGHLSPQNPHALSHPQAHDYSKTVVTRLIMEAKLAPFYRGLEDYEEDWSLDDISKVVDEVRAADLEGGVSNSVTERMKEDKAQPGGVGSVAKKMGINKAKAAREREEREAVLDREKRAYLNATECPICFLNYPPNINTSRCCQQPLCTECFVQIKRGDATLTHLESDPACCPYCMETDFGVIYERPPTPTSTQRSMSSSALATSPEGATSGFSQALSLGDDDDADLSMGPGMAPKVQETVRRKSVNAKDKQVVTIDEIRPDWEDKLNAVKAAAARKASRRIVMRQVGDRLVPIGFTSSRATGTADFSMSIGTGTDENGSRRRRAAPGRERDLEELMIMEAMRLSVIDHEEHQRKQTTVEPGTNLGGGPPPTNTSGSTTPIPSGEPSTSTSSFRRRAGTEGSNSQPPAPVKEKATSKLFSKFGNRSRSGSNASQRVTFAPDTSRRGSIAGMGMGSGLGSGASSSSNLPAGGVDHSPGPNPSSPLVPTTSSSTATVTSSPLSSAPGSAVPRISLDMAPLTPEPAFGAGAARSSVDTTRTA
ncbi:uncharacterized protein MKK02DRAFT_42787 [Dioszegia hungarica]|uniref:RING-type domain-containing protein n=1 Tax=Dioszegia hungarica TaxID=4972 RepID=A0AA38LXZ0_9TREE|nr:uncharacterized protein MKK02DRAFT_42787 [Dioszegia hungarica]KAI9638399.1 hypothetical protein MKK02DRAFT_42787 [Dioszegia hungarica]